MINPEPSSAIGTVHIQKLMQNRPCREPHDLADYIPNILTCWRGHPFDFVPEPWTDHHLRRSCTIVENRSMQIRAISIVRFTTQQVLIA